MSFTKNEINVRGYVNYLKQKQFGDGFSYEFSITLAAGKDKQGNYKSEYFNVLLSSTTSKSNAGKFKDGDFVQVEGRLRNRPYEKDGQKQYYPYIEGFDIFCLVPKKIEQAEYGYQGHGELPF